MSWETLRPSTQPIAVAQGNIEYVERFTYLGSVISRDGDVEADINTRLAKAAAVVRRLDNVCGDPARLAWRLDWISTPPSSSLQSYIYASETWKSTVRIRQQLDVFHHRNLQKILGITCKDHVTNIEVLSRTGQRRLQDIVAERRLRMAGHIIRMPPGRPANHAMSWTPVVMADDEVVLRKLGGPHLKRTWWTEESIGTASRLWLQTGADGELLLPIVLSRTW